ncbi:MAG: hypothetical protein M1840_004754 [Geoglossum simile]|nr:MAG: hypothetical protein M1840_004754 [Geoglossum simile]
MTETTTKPIESSEGKSEDGYPVLPECGDNIDPLIFAQILEMDDDDEREFSHSIVYGFFEQAVGTFNKMEESLKSSDLLQLSALGHFLKGSSATLGLTKVKEGCEVIQICGAKGKEDGESKTKTRLEKIETTLNEVRTQYTEAEKILKKFYEAKKRRSG